MYLGLDIGTSGVKALLINTQQKIVGSASSGLEVSRPHPGWSEQDPNSWLTACDQAIEALRKAYPEEFVQLKAISLSGQMHGATLLDSNNNILRPCMLWNDTRSHVEAAELDSNPRFREISGNIVFPGFTAPKLVWVARNEPNIFNQVAKVLLPKDYVAFWLTGRFVTDLSDASGTSWVDVAKRCWSDELLRLTGMRTDQMPEIHEGSEATGTLKAELQERWDLPEQVIIGAGAGDNAASAIGMGIVDEGQAFLSLGTSGVLFTATDGYKPNAASAVHAFCHALPKTWHQMGVILSASDSLNWFAKTVDRTAQDLDAELPASVNGPANVKFLPYLSGERTPHNDAAIRGAFVGLAHETKRTELTQATMEGVAFAIRDNLEALRVAGSDPQEIIAVGGATRSSFWLETLANILNKPILLPEDGDFGAAFGAARLAILATGSDPSKVLTTPRIKRTFLPNTDLQPKYEQAYEQFRQLYPALKKLAVS